MHEPRKDIIRILHVGICNFVLFNISVHENVRAGAQSREGMRLRFRPQGHPITSILYAIFNVLKARWRHPCMSCSRLLCPVLPLALETTVAPEGPPRAHQRRTEKGEKSGG
jgi:hypothetical protein